MNLSPAPAWPEHNLWHYVWKLLRLRVRIFASSFVRAKARQKIGYVFLMLFVVALFAGALAASWGILSLLRAPELREFMDPSLLVSSVPVLITTGAFLAILLTSFGVLLQALYLAGDMDFLLASPVPVRAVFVAKLLQAILPNFGLVALFGLPVLYGLGAANGYNVLYFVLVPLVLAALALAAAGISGLLVMLIVRVVPARRVAEVLAFVGAIFSMVCSQSGRFAERLNVSETQTTQALQMLARLNTPWSPLAWAGRGLLDLGTGHWLTALPLLGLTLGLAAGAFALALVTAERWYYTGWARMQGTARRKRAARPARPAVVRQVPLVGLATRLIPAPVRALIAKDFLTLRRDLRNMSQLVAPLIFGIIYTFMLTSREGGAPEMEGAPAFVAHAMQNIQVYGTVGISLFVGWSLLSRLALMGFSQEGRHYWLLKTAPLSPGQLLLAKFAVAYLPTLALGWLFLLGVSLFQRVNLSMLLFGLPAVALTLAGAAGINLAFGVAGANLVWEDPRRMIRGGPGCLSALASMAYLLLSLVLFFGPPVGAALLGLSQLLGQLAGLLLGGTVSLACAIFPPMLVRNRVPLIGEA